MAAPAFSSSAEDPITRSISIKSNISTVPNPSTKQDLAFLESLYEVEWTAKEIEKGSYKKVALQFPDELLHISVPIFQALKSRLDNDVGVYILADTSYGSCCVDEVAAQHVEGDVVVHYGHSCLSRPSRLPVIYVFSKAQLDVQHAAHCLLMSACEECAEAESPQVPKSFILLLDVAYGHLVDELSAAILASPLLPQNSQVFYNHLPKHDDPVIPSPSKASAEVANIEPSPSLQSQSGSSSATPNLSVPHRRYTLPESVSLADCTILYVGPESLGLNNLLMTHPNNKVISYDPACAHNGSKIESVRTNKLLMRRYAMVQRARDADVIGILVGTLGVASYLPLVSQIRTMLRAHRKKSYTLSVGKLSPSKLANFAEIECFVLVACPENSVIDAKEFLRPIITPFELSLALSENSWPGNYILDFEYTMKNLSMGNEDPNREETETDSDKPLFSLVTGKYRHPKRYGGENLSPQSISDTVAVVLRNKETTLAKLPEGAGAVFLQQRSFRGLEKRLGQDAPSVLEQGRSGVAKAYQDDHKLPGDEG